MKVMSASLRAAFLSAMATASAEMSVAVIRTRGSSFATVIAMAPLPVPMSAQASSPAGKYRSMRERICAHSSSVSGRGISTSPLTSIL